MAIRGLARCRLDSLLTIGFIGAGRAATVLGVALAKGGYSVVAVASRTEASAKAAAKAIEDAGSMGCLAVSQQSAADAADLVLVTTNDGAIGEIARTVRWRAGQAVVHCSGALGADVLDSAGHTGAWIGSWHPFQTLTGTATLDGVAFGIEADDELYRTLAAMAVAVGGNPLPVAAEARALYHASSVMACGYLTTLLRDARRVWEAAGLPEEAGRRAIGAIASATVRNVIEFGEDATMTGPVSRGDIGTVRLHLESLRSSAPELLDLYTAISLRSVQLALDAGRPTEALSRWDALYDEFRSEGREG